MGLLLYFFFFVPLTVLRDRNNHNNASDRYLTKVSLLDLVAKHRVDQTKNCSRNRKH